ncbi:MAG TPA: hypothetical protein VGM41_03045 [Chitinophagaceae bacterium]|jgi:hypothetical protein
MNKVEFIFDGSPQYALYNITHLDGVEEYYLELRDKSLIAEFGLSLRFRRDRDGQLDPTTTAGGRKKNLLETILLSINRQPQV